VTTGQPVAELTASPGFLLSRVGTAIQAGFKEVLAGWKLRPLQFLILQVLGSAGGVSQQELCRVVRVDSGNMVELVDGLEALEFARRDPDPADRRRHIVTITEPGRAALATITQAVGDYTDGFLSPLTAAERQQLTRVLGKLYATTPEGTARSSWATPGPAETTGDPAETTGDPPKTTGDPSPGPRAGSGR
jgi:MarR family transcriptional regulator, lower aerobic nicotinate degradation pathway regulator